MPTIPKQELVLDNDELYRRIPPILYNLDIADYYQKKNHLPSSVFKPCCKGQTLSVNVARLTTIKKTLSDHKGFALASIIAGSIRELQENGEGKLDIIHTPNDDNEAHADIIGNITKVQSKAMANKAKVIVEWPKE